MRGSLQHMATGVALGSVLLGAAAVPESAAARTSCDPSYPTVCIAPAEEIGDLDCWQIIVALPVIHDPQRGAYDSHGLDGDFDGVGCEPWSILGRP